MYAYVSMYACYFLPPPSPNKLCMCFMFRTNQEGPKINIIMTHTTMLENKTIILSITNTNMFPNHRTIVTDQCRIRDTTDVCMYVCMLMSFQSGMDGWNRRSIE